MVAAIIRTFDLERLIAADPLELLFLQDAQQLGLGLQTHVADFVQEQRAAVGRLELALAPRRRAGKGALLVAEQLALDQLARERRAVHRDKRRAGARTAEMDRVRHQLLAGARFAPDQHRHVGRRDFVDRLENPHHRARAANHVLEASRFQPHLFDQLAVRALEQLLLHHVADLEPQLVVVEGLGQIIFSPGLHRLDRDPLRSVRRDHQDCALGIDRAHLAQQVEPAHALHAQVGDDHVEQAGLDLLERVFAGLGGIDLVAFLGEEPLERDQDSALVVNDKQPSLHSRCSLVIAVARLPARRQSARRSERHRFERRHAARRRYG